MEHRLADGTRILVRPIQPEDAGELRRVFSQLSPVTRERRFLTAVDALSDSALKYLTDVDQENHVALVATTDSLDMKSERGVGVARFIRLKDEPDVAEAAVTVADDMQHRGVGGALLRELAHMAHEKGVHRFRGEILASNEPMRNLMEKLGAKLVRTESDTLVFDVPVGVSEGAFHMLQTFLKASASAAFVFFRTLGHPHEKSE